MANLLYRSAWTLRPELFRQVMTRKDYQSTMLETEGRIYRDGSIYELKGKSLGAGIYEVTLKEWNATQGRKAEE